VVVDGVQKVRPGAVVKPVALADSNANTTESTAAASAGGVR
jgi:hypothetical protein